MSKCSKRGGDMKAIIGLVTILALSGCEWAPYESRESGAESSAQELEIVTLRARTELAEGRLDEIEKRLETIEGNAVPSYAILTPGGSGYSVANTRLGPVLVSLGDMEIRGKGSRVQLSIGNLSSAQIEGAELTLVYSADQDTPKAGQVHLTEHSHLGALPPGAWSIAWVNLPELKPEELGELRVGVRVDVLRLR